MEYIFLYTQEEEHNISILNKIWLFVNSWSTKNKKIASTDSNYESADNF